MLTVGCTVSTVKVRCAGVGSQLPAASQAATVKVWSPSAMSVNDVGELHAVTGAPSRAHVNVAPGSDENAKAGSWAAESTAGPESTAVSGGVVSGAGPTGATYAKARSAGVLSLLPALSIAKTLNTCGPGATTGSVWAEAHLAAAPPSSRHLNLERFSLEV